MDAKTIFNKVLSKITPPKNPAVSDFLLLFKKSCPFPFILGGSYAKNTHIGTTFDCDIFVQFNTEKEITKLKTYVISFCKNHNASFIPIHGSRKYYRIFYKDVIFELVPVIAQKNLSDAKNIMDHSPFHVAWFIDAGGKNYSNDIRLLKQLFKANRVYGAESYIGGFSGHVIDLLIIHYKGFIPTLNAIASWKKTTLKSHKKIVIDVINAYKGKDVLFFMNESKTQSPLVVVDPVLSERNAAAALHPLSFNRAIDIAKKCLTKPSLDLFEINLLSLNMFPKNTISVIFKPVLGDLDTAGAKIKKAIEYAITSLHKCGFEVKTYDWEWRTLPSHATCFFVFESLTIPKTYIHKGPPIAQKNGVVAFKKKYSNTLIKNGFLYTKLSRKHTFAKDSLVEILSDLYVKERVSDVIVQ